MKRAALFVVLSSCGSSGSSEPIDAAGAPRDAVTDSVRDSRANDDAGEEEDSTVDAGLNNCGEMDFEDHRVPGDDRTITWELTVVPRCMIIAKGQSVTWLGSLSQHPLTSKGGDTPTPIELISTGASATIGFQDLGDYGFVCVYHRAMQGVIRVR